LISYDYYFLKQLETQLERPLNGWFCTYKYHPSDNGLLAYRRCEFDRSGRLIQLHLCDLELSQIPSELGQFSALRELQMNYNRLSSLPAELGQLTSLQQLQVSHNRLSSLPAELGQLTSLRRLDLGHNRLSSLPAELGHLPFLHLLQVNGNPLPTPPSKIIAQGAKATLSYLRNSQRNRFSKRAEREQPNTEIEEAEQHLWSGQERAAGVLAGVALESHLKKLCHINYISYAEKTRLQVLIQTLQDEEVITFGEAKILAKLASIRNKCAHSDFVSKREVRFLVREVKKFIDWMNDEMYSYGG
jgi:Leucine-rich repeat (LRR) protein